MAPSAVATPQVLTDPGYLFWAPLATAEPTNTVTASKFSDAWGAGWLPLGATTDGSEFSYAIKTENIMVAEFFDPIKIVTTERSGSITFSLADFTAKKLQYALNGGATLVSTGATTTTMTTVEAPNPGNEVRAMIGWESLDNTARIICRQVIQSSEVKFSAKKAPAFSDVPCTFAFEVPLTAKPFSVYFAGVTATAGGRG
jgi:hypothetical protein